MAYKKRVYRRKYVKRASSASAGVKALKLVKQIKRVSKPEIKFRDHKNSSIATYSTATVPMHVGIGQGPTVNQRLGDSIKPLRLSGYLELNANDTASTSQLRVIFFRGKKENGFVPAWNDVFDSSSSDSIAYQYNWWNRSQYTILSDKMYSFSQANVIQRFVKISLRLSGTVKYERESNNVSEDGGIFMIVLGGSNASEEYPDYEYSFRLTYTDT